MLDRGTPSPLTQCLICKEAVDYWEPSTINELEGGKLMHNKCMLTEKEMRDIINHSKFLIRYYTEVLNDRNE